jgi:hypothetical protein
VVVNNLVYAPNVTGTAFENGGNGTTLDYFEYIPVTSTFSLVAANTTNAQIKTLNPGWSPSAGAVNSQGFGFPTANYTPGKGIAVPLWEDFNGNPRTGANDQGAFVH